MPNGGTLTIQTKKNGHIEIIIQDTGKGISKEDLLHIFDPFYSKTEGGTGLGLSITYQIIKEHGGSIEVESEVGKGTAVTIKLAA